MWRHTASVDYAIKILICLANEKRALSSSLLANHVETSPRYVLYICKKLKDAGIVLAFYGTNGGFALRKDPRNICIYDVATAMGQHIEYSPVKRIDSKFDKLLYFYSKQTAQLLIELKSTSIADLC